MNIKTHTAYPEFQTVQESPVFIMRAIIQDGKGKVKHKELFLGEDKEEALGKCKDYVARQAPKYLRKESK